MSRGRILVTGATGMVGSLLAERALEEGYEVRAMVRPSSNRDILDGAAVEFVEADLAKPESLPAALNDVDYVVHTAAHVGDWGPLEEFRAINVFALEHMVTAARHAGRLQRWIQISSLGVYPARHHYGSDETMPPDLHAPEAYPRTKAEADILLGRHIREHAFPAVILRPGFLYGPRDRHVVPRIVEQLAAGKMKLLGNGRRLLNNTYAGNLVEAILLALAKDGIVGETFNIRDERLVTREEYVKVIADYMGRPMPRRVPEWLARLAVPIFEGAARLRGATKAPLLTRARIKFLCLNLDYSIAKAKSQLGYQPQVDFRDGMRVALEWAEAHNLIPQPTSSPDKP